MKIHRVVGIIFWLVYVFLASISFLSLAYADDWGEVKEGLRARIVLLQPEYVMGQPMRFRLEMTNISDSELTYQYYDEMLVHDYFSGLTGNYDSTTKDGPTTFPFFSPIIVKDANGKEAPFVNLVGYQTMANGKATIKPGEVVIRYPEIDISKLYYIDQPGRYTIQTLEDERNSLPRSNVLEIEIRPGRLSDLDIVTGCLLKILPREWRISSRLQNADSSGLCLYHNPAGLKSNELVIKIWQSKEPDPKGDYQHHVGEILRGVSSIVGMPIESDYQYLGKTTWGTYVYIALPDKVNLVWPNMKEEISKALKIVQKEE